MTTETKGEPHIVTGYEASELLYNHCRHGNHISCKQAQLLTNPSASTEYITEYQIPRNPPH
jgi:hypothetical protein